MSWMTLEAGTPVRSRDGSDVGKVEEVVADTTKDIFSGINVARGLIGGSYFVPADAIETITEEAVSLGLSTEEVESL